MTNNRYFPLMILPPTKCSPDIRTSFYFTLFKCSDVTEYLNVLTEKPLIGLAFSYKDWLPVAEK